MCVGVNGSFWNSRSFDLFHGHEIHKKLRLFIFYNFCSELNKHIYIETMRSGDQLSQISDEECYASGCPSCRLDINKDTGRLKYANLIVEIIFIHLKIEKLNFLSKIMIHKIWYFRWCVGRNKFCRAWIKCMLLIPAVILPIIIIFIALSRSTVIGTFSHHQTTEKST